MVAIIWLGAGQVELIIGWLVGYLSYAAITLPVDILLSVEIRKYSSVSIVLVGSSSQYVLELS